jgi:hypothetical protein
MRLGKINLMFDLCLKLMQLSRVSDEMLEVHFFKHLFCSWDIYLRQKGKRICKELHCDIVKTDDCEIELFTAA